MDLVCISGLSHNCKTSTSPHSARNRPHNTSVVLCGHRVARVLFSFLLLPHPAPAHAVWSEPEWGHSHLGNKETNNRLIIGSFLTPWSTSPRLSDGITAPARASIGKGVQDRHRDGTTFVDAKGSVPPATAASELLSRAPSRRCK